MDVIRSRIPFQFWGTVTELSPSLMTIAGLYSQAAIGAEVRVGDSRAEPVGEVLRADRHQATVSLYSSSTDIRLGDRAWLNARPSVNVGDHMLGHIVNYNGEIHGQPCSWSIGTGRPLAGNTPEASERRGLGPRLHTGWVATDAFVPICRGQRIGLFAGSGVGKSTFLGALSGGIEADRIVIALIGERSRELNEFIRQKISSKLRSRTCIVSATASESAGAKRRAAYSAMSIAEHFRDQGHHVLLLFDSLTRFAEAHREIALFAGETPALNAYPPSTARVISELVERAGPGAADQGDISAVFSVLVAGSDHEEPLADMIRGILDGHIVLCRKIAERGRYPAIDIVKSVSRCLPDAATIRENEMLRETRRLVSILDDLEPMLRANLYEAGTDAEADRAIELFPLIDSFIGESNEGGPTSAFDRLRTILALDEKAIDEVSTSTGAKA